MSAACCRVRMTNGCGRPSDDALSCSEALRLLGLLLHTHVQSRAASWDSCGCVDISLSGVCFCDDSLFRQSWSS